MISEVLCQLGHLSNVCLLNHKELMKRKNNGHLKSARSSVDNQAKSHFLMKTAGKTLGIKSKIYV